MKSGWFIVIVMGVFACLMRAAGPGSIADVAALAYLVTATVVFDRSRRNAPAGAHSTRSQQSLRA
jgi:hypothetical protein